MLLTEIKNLSLQKATELLVLFEYEEDKASIKTFITDSSNLKEINRILNSNKCSNKFIKLPYQVLCQKILDKYVIKNFDHLSTYNLDKFNSSKINLLFSQKFFLLLSVCIIVCLIFLNHAFTITYLFISLNILYLAELSFKVILFLLGFWHNIFLKKRIEPHLIEENELPIYTILIPLYKEANMIERINETLFKLDYPQEKLDIKVILESCDNETILSAKEKLCFPHHLIIIPPYGPKTKPKALNLALLFAKGKLVTIYDAEDEPESLQLKQAVVLFKNNTSNLACVQAKLNFRNRKYNLLTKLFALEYAIWFEYVLVGLSLLKMPIPLGGNSNHFRLDNLKASGAWDPYNVTEDADLGIRLSKYNYETQLFDSFTYEEGTFKIENWLGQRSRWIKGFYQTYFVHSRKPIQAIKKLGLKKFIGFQFFIGLQSSSFLISPIISLSWIGLNFFYVQELTDVAKTLLIFNISLYVFNSILFSVIVSLQKKWSDNLFTIFLYPFYFILHSIASFKAFFEFLFKPHYWFKTPHGIKD
ncbi:MAG: glycosyltransferase [Sphingobacteriia bacterium]|nr:glycosyltransferase [Sphingobacteriia bacterium]